MRHQGLTVGTVLLLASISSCLHNPSSGAKSDWQDKAAADGSRPYVIDWPCEPKRFGSSAEDTVGNQEEYCEWKSEAGTDTESSCRFTTSFDNSRDFYLNSRGETPFNTIGAAQALRSDCINTALRLLDAKKSPGHLCSSIAEQNCVVGRNSDPEICDKVRWVTGQNFHNRLDFSIDEMPAENVPFSPMPLMRMGLLTGLPKGCTYSQADKTEVICKLPKGSTCFAIAGQIRTGLRVLTTKYTTSLPIPPPVVDPAPAATPAPAPVATPTAGLSLSDGSSVRNPGATGVYPAVVADPLPPAEQTGN